MNMKTKVLDLSGKAAGDLDLDPAVFGLTPRADILNRVVLWQLAKRRAGTHAVKERGDVSGSTKKIVRQKGSGGARHGSKRGAQFRGGGIIFGPVVRDHAHDLPKKVRKLGLRMALSDKAQNGNLIIVKDFNLKDHKTKTALSTLETLKIGGQKTVMIDAHEVTETMTRGIFNIVGVDILPQIGANVYDIIRKEKLVMTVEAVKALEDRLK
jgi:large subunit ribosomal protein L4